MPVTAIGVIIAGLLSLALSVFHIPQVWQHFFASWSEGIGRLDLLSRKLISTILIALSLMLLLFAFISMAYANELNQGTGLAQGLLIALSLFWLWRAVWQLAYFPPSKIEHSGFLLFLNYSVVAISIINAVLYALPIMIRRQ